MRSKFRKVVAELSRAIQDGELKPGQKLPTHRELAYTHGLSLNTASRVFSELEALGLTIGEVGRGTFVRADVDIRAVEFSLDDPDMQLADFSRNVFVLPEQDKLFRQTMDKVLSRTDFDVLDYRGSAGSAYDRLKAMDWLNGSRKRKLENVDDILITSGGQHALLVALLCLCRPGDVVGAEKLTYPLIRLLAEDLRLEVLEVPSDAQGISAEGLDAICKTTRLRAVFAMPNMQNPTSVTMPLKRREDLIDVMRRHGVFMVEDDAFGFLLEKRAPSFSELCPELSFFTSTFSKSWAPGLRVAYLVVPEAYRARAIRAQGSTIWMPTPIMMSFVSELISGPDYDGVVAMKRKEIRKRQKILQSALGEFRLLTAPDSMHACVYLPPKKRTDPIISQLMARKVKVSSLRQFAAAHDASPTSEGLRLCIGAPRSRNVMENALIVIAETIR